MASKRSEVAELNKMVLEYVERLGMSEEAKLEFKTRANCMEALGFYRSSWFDRVTAGLSHILHQIQLPRPQIDLNEPPTPQHNCWVEAEASGNARGKRKRVGSPLHIRESKSNIRPSHQLPSIQLSDGDSD